MHLRVLTHVDGRQVEAERLDSAQESLDAEQAGVRAAVLSQARDDGAEVALELGGARVAVRAVAPRRVEPCRDQPKQQAIGYVAVARRHRGQRRRGPRAVVGDAVPYG